MDVRRSSAKVGNCHICGGYGALSFEHVPPESAFNDRTVVTPDTKWVFELRDLDKLPDLKGKQSQRGQGGYTLCERCNSRTGHWYGSHYAAWVYQGAGYLARSKGAATQLAYPYHLLPLRVIKQIVCMFFSVNGARFREAQPQLERLVLNNESRGLPPHIKIYVGYLHADRSREAGVAASVQLGDGVRATQRRVYSEISFFPFSYILSFDSPAPEHEMLDITFFANYGYNDFATLHLPIPTLSVYTPFPGDFRNRETVLRQAHRERDL